MVVCHVGEDARSPCHTAMGDGPMSPLTLSVRDRQSSLKMHCGKHVTAIELLGKLWRIHLIVSLRYSIRSIPNVNDRIVAHGHKREWPATICRSHFFVERPEVTRCFSLWIVR